MNQKLYKFVQWGLFALLFIYILLRIIFTETLHDEIGTYMFYFYHGDYMGETIQWDANNHLLNSFIGHQIYKVFGDNMVILRLPNLIAFVFYFWGTVKLTRDFKTPGLNTIALVALNTIPFVLEYFSVARGYGLAFGFLVWGIYYGLQHLKVYNLFHLFMSYGFLLLAVASNLTLVLTALMFLGFNVIYPYWIGKKLTISACIKEWLVHLMLLIGLYPLVRFAFALRTGGALYYGSLDGFWEVTGKTLSRYVLFWDANALKYIYIVLFIAMIIGVFLFLRKTSLREWIQQPLVIYTLLFFGSVVAVNLMALLMEVNYPEDRTGMYFIPFFLLLSFHLLDQYKIGKWLQWVFLFFPVTFCFHITLDTSVFTADERINTEFYDKVKNEIRPGHTVMIFPTMNWNWVYNESHEERKSNVAQYDNPTSFLVDILVSKIGVVEDPKVNDLYDVIAIHPNSGYIAYKRKKSLPRKKVISSDPMVIRSSAEFIPIATFDSINFEGKSFIVEVSGHLKTTQVKNKISLVVQVVDEDGSTSRYLPYLFEAVYQGQLIDNDFRHHFVLEELTAREKKIKVYLWNRALNDIDLSEGRSVIYELTGLEK